MGEMHLTVHRPYGLAHRAGRQGGRTAACLTLVILAAIQPARAEDWPAWRGPRGNGHSADSGFPLRWSASENVRWKKELPGPGNSTPIVTGHRVFVTCASDQGRRRSLICLDRATGQVLWERHVQCDNVEPTHESNPHCSSSPVTDGQRVVAWHGSAGIVAYDLDGTELWRKDVGRFEHVWGTGSSPVLHQDAVIVNCGPGLQSFVVALDKRTGDELWRRTFPEMTSADIDEYRGSWSTPVIDKVNERDLLFLSLPLWLYAVDPLTGADVWRSGGLGKLVYTNPLTSPETVVAMSGYEGPVIAVDPRSAGDITTSHRRWIHDQKNPQRVGSGVIVGPYIYVLNEPGIAWCIELATGEILWKQRLGKVASWSSLCHAEGRLYVANQAGTTYVVKPDPSECTVLAENELGEPMNASLAFSEGQVFARTFQHVYCIQNPAP